MDNFFDDDNDIDSIHQYRKTLDSIGEAFRDVCDRADVDYQKNELIYAHFSLQTLMDTVEAKYDDILRDSHDVRCHVQLKVFLEMLLRVCRNILTRLGLEPLD